MHALAARYSVLLGLVQLIRRKGDRALRLLERVWVGTMVFTCVSSFGILSAGSFSPLHALAAWTLFTVVFGLIMARSGDINPHAFFMVASYLGLLGALVWSRFRLAGCRSWTCINHSSSAYGCSSLRPRLHV